MNEKEFKELQTLQSPCYDVTAEEIKGPDRTLLYGYTCEKYTWHVYLKEGEIHKLVYGYPNFFVSYTKRYGFNLKDLVPNKRVYPWGTDFELAKRFVAASIHVPYLPFDAKVLKGPHPGRFAGLTREQVMDLDSP